MRINYFINGFKTTRDCFHVCTQEYEHYKNVYILSKDKVYGISFVELFASKTIIKIAEISLDFPFSEIANKYVTAFDWTPINYWIRPGEEMNYLKHLASIFDFEQQLSLQVALQEILSDAIPAVAVQHNGMIAA